MLLASIFSLLTVILCYLIFSRYKFVKSFFLRISLAWFLSQYISTFIIFILSTILVLITSNVLYKSSLTYVGLTALISIIFLPHFLKEVKIIKQKLYHILLFKIILGILLALFSYLLFSVHLAQKEGVIYTSPVYWDFKLHVPIIQNFVYGDNFPPENVAFTDIPMTYHYFFDLLTAIYSVVGLDLINAVNYLSIVSFFFMLLAIIGISEELFKSIRVGVIAVFLTVTSSSLRFINYFSAMNGKNLFEIIGLTLINNQHPYFFSFIKDNPFGYNGTMFNIFYFINERQMIFAVLFIIFSTVIFLNIKRFSYLLCIFVGGMIGLFFQWHLFATINIGFVPFILFFFAKERRKILLVLIGFGISFILQSLYFKAVTNTEWFYTDVAAFPKINFNFPTMGNIYPPSLLNAIDYYVYAYGLKIIFLYFGLLSLFRNNRKALLLTTSFIVPAFVLTNTIQLSPISVYDNHKWLRPMNVILDIVVAYALVKIFFKKNIIKKLIGILFLFILTLSGFIELMPFINSRPSQYFANYYASMIRQIRQSTHPRSTFLSNNQSIILLAGRKVFMWMVPGQDLRLNYGLRTYLANLIYNSPDLVTFCNFAQKYQIDYVELNNSMRDIPIYNTLISYKSLQLIDKESNVTFVDTGSVCKNDIPLR